MAFTNATKRHHWTSTRSNITLSSAPVDMLAPNNNSGMTYQTDEKLSTNLTEYFVGVVKLACYSINTCLLLCIFINNLFKYLSNTSKNN
jgi:hypothetical protein